MTLNEDNNLQTELTNLIKKIIDSHNNSIKKEDAVVIIKEIIPHLDNLVSERIKMHFIELSKFIIEKFEKEKEL